jgi:hypothetical protein
MTNRFTKLPDVAIDKLRERHGRIVEIHTDSDADPVIYCRMPRRAELERCGKEDNNYLDSWNLLSTTLVAPHGSFEQIFGDRQGLVIAYANHLLDACGVNVKTTARVY